MSSRGLGISTGSFYPEPTKNTIERIARLGFKQVEVTIQNSELNYDFHRKMDVELFEKLRIRTREHGLSISSVHAPFLTSPQVFSTKVRIEILIKSLEIASMLQSNELVVHPYHVFRSYEEACSFLQNPTLPLANFIVPGFLSVLRNAKDHGVRIAVENIAHWYDSPLLNEPENMRSLVSGLNSEWVKIDLDTFHAELGGTTLEFIELFGDSIISIHLCDHTDSWQRTMPGKGRVDWNELAKQSKRLHGLEHIVIEVSGRQEDPDIRESADFLRRVFGLDEGSKRSSVQATKHIS